MRRLLGLVVCAVWLMAAGRAQAQACDSGSASVVTQHGVTFTFDTSYQCGQFANGDYWVVPASPTGSVTVTSITPDFAGERNGWEVNPSDTSAHGFDGRVNGYDGALVPSLPYQAGPNSSLVKGLSANPSDASCRPCLQSAAVLTVLDGAPPGDGASVFRPPYFGVEKPLYPSDQLRTDLLPALGRISGAPTQAEITARFQRPWLDHKSGWTGAGIHPEDNMPEYGSAVGAGTGSGALALMLDDPLPEKMPSVIAYTQVGIDLYHAFKAGTTWGPNGGHGNGRKLVLTMTAVLLDNKEMADAVKAAPPDAFSEDGSVYYSATAAKILWGQAECTEDKYWGIFWGSAGSKTCNDPYGYIDGGEEPGGSYQYCCNSGTWRGTALALHLMPELRCVWPAEQFVPYVDRWVQFGAWSQPDPCAPFDGDPNNYGKTFGPDGKGGCIKDTNPSDGVGRFVSKHGTGANEGSHSSSFHVDMWAAYRAAAPTTGQCIPVGTAGAGGTGGSGGSASGGASSTPEPGSDDGGCGCRAAAGRRSSLALLCFFALALLRLRRRRNVSFSGEGR